MSNSLAQLIIHLKNIIFFKVTIYILIIAGLSSLLSYYTKELFIVKEHRNIAKNTLNDIENKLYGILSADDKIIQTYNNYKTLLENANQNNCGFMAIFQQNITSIGLKYQLPEPIEVKASVLFDERSESNRSHIKVVNTNVEVTLKLLNLSSLVGILKDISSFLSNDSIIYSIETKEITTLDYNIINNLRTDQLPALILVKINIIIRQIIKV